MTLVFKNPPREQKKFLLISKDAGRAIAPYLAKAKSPDRYFVYSLLAATGICVVPLSSGFNSCLQGFRFTLLKKDAKKFEKTINILAEAIDVFL